MADQSNLTITGIGGDPSGSHPIGSLNVNWTPTTDDSGTLWTANTIMTDPGASAADATDTYYSEVLCLGPVQNGSIFRVASSADAQIAVGWQWYNPATSGVDADFVAGAALGTAGTFGNGTWTDIGTAAQNYAVNYLTPEVTADALAMAKGTMLRVKMVVTDADSNGVNAGLVTAAVASINAATCLTPVTRENVNNKAMIASYSGEATSGSIGGIGADPS